MGGDCGYNSFILTILSQLHILFPSGPDGKSNTRASEFLGEELQTCCWTPELQPWLPLTVTAYCFQMLPGRQEDTFLNLVVGVWAAGRVNERVKYLSRWMQSGAGACCHGSQTHSRE